MTVPDVLDLAPLASAAGTMDEAIGQDAKLAGIMAGLRQQAAASPSSAP